MNTTPLSLLLAVFLATSLSGEEAAKHTCRLLFVDRPADASASLHLFDGTISREVELPGMNLSRVYELPAGPLTLRLLRTPIDDPEKLPPGAPSATVASEVTDFYLLVFSDPSNEVTPVRMQIVDAAAQPIRPGQMLWRNLTTSTVQGTLGTEELLLPPDSSAVLNPPRQGVGDYSVSLSYRPEGKDTAAPICQTNWTHVPHARQLGLVFTKSGARRPSVAVFPDFR